MIFNLKLFHFYPAFFFKFNIIVFKIFSYSSFTVIKILQFERTKGMVLDTFVVVARYDCRNGGSFAALLVDYRRRRRLIN